MRLVLSWFERILKAGMAFADSDNFLNFHNPGAKTKSVVGAVLASASTIAPTHLIHHVSGTTAVVNITLPYTGFEGFIILIPDGAFTTTTAGNIAVAITAVVSRPLIMVYDPVQAKWYPHAIA